jgi:hypothetical protein
VRASLSSGLRSACVCGEHRFGGPLQQSVTTTRLRTTPMFHAVRSSTRVVNLLTSPPVQSAQPSPYILWKSRITRRLSATCRLEIALVRAARLPWPTRRALSGILAITRNRVRTHAIGPPVHTPLVIGKIQFTRLLCFNFGVNAPSTVAKIVNKLTVPKRSRSLIVSSDVVLRATIRELNEFKTYVNIIKIRTKVPV